ncbi:MAG TPA: FAD-linked oxidase C-terminal domain-containing protein [Burkholderiales bacterium]|jgi:D-lactate dehydrogenase (cytochrome)|nr:FAD-linked oxidase C-terminal domain-containing protein [Burkholderiales bacterium]
MNQPLASKYLRRELPAILLEELKAVLGPERVSVSQAVREHHGKDESSFPYALPDAVVFPETTEEVSKIVKACAQHKFPVIPYGTGTSLEGHILAIHGGISVDVSRMNNVLAVHAEDLDAVVQAGVTRKQLNAYIKDTGLFFPIDPGADASIGGMSATRASGTAAVRYGTMRENVMALTVVMADGRIVKTGRRTKKSSAGYDLTRLFVGSEGTLGIITEVTVKLYPQPEALSAAVCCFPSMVAAADTVIAAIQLGVPVARCDFVDPLCVRAINQFSKLTLKEVPTVFFEFHGTPSSVKEQAELVQQIATENGAEDFSWATKAEDRSKLWQARHDAYFACLQLQPGSRIISTDVCVPISRLAECLAETEKDIAASGRLVPVLGHIGDGNFHLCIVVNPESDTDLHAAEEMNQRLVHRAIAMEGTCTGEHGIGMGKLEFLREEHGNSVDVMLMVKQALDPDNIMNPGKVVSS